MTKRDIKFLLTDLEILHSKKITEAEAASKDPQIIYHENNEVYEWKEPELTHEDIVEALLAKQTESINAIKNICSFFAFVLAALLLLGFILLLSVRF
ncbi:hypothetical protein [Anaerocolumna xylanovorans]|uniref:Uncharacterized protein n=1 Tax=Anaerocolumna xylanovorans DSM 12503 TaxID=1121345 RepID=A0A1M7Y656_9FIRM|nr:hypothetical protein [Anaerocolumna xylanovorans]SHO48119.1 hypothetical protein SAMN02745217_01685 [Anaerocolumna xylanovorans DSM 12503]